jgi:vancomycin resistance protein VanW
MFWNGEVVTGLGGGVCIVSTALYNAVLKAGYRIIERGHHSGPVRYADPGFDAAVAYSCLDMRFKNNTTSPVMIRCWIEDRRLIVSLRGRKRPGFEVRIVTEGYKELPFKVVETEDPTVPEGEVKVEVPARVGFEVTIVRVLKQDGKVVKREILNHDRIPPRDKIVLIPPKPQEENPGEADSPKDALASGSKPPVSAEEAAQTGAPKPASTAAVTKPEDKESPQASATRAEPPQPDEPIEVNLDVKP